MPCFKPNGFRQITDLSSILRTKQSLWRLLNARIINGWQKTVCSYTQRPNDEPARWPELIGRNTFLAYSAIPLNCSTKRSLLTSLSECDCREKQDIGPQLADSQTQERKKEGKISVLLHQYKQWPQWNVTRSKGKMSDEEREARKNLSVSTGVFSVIMSGSGGELQRVWLPVDLLPRDLIRLITALDHVQYPRVHLPFLYI